MPIQNYPISVFDTNGVVRQIMTLPIDYAGNPTTKDYAPIGQIVVNNVTQTPWIITKNVGTNTWKQLATGGTLEGGLNGQVLIGNTATGIPIWNNITSTGGSIVITNGPNTINLESVAAETVATLQTTTGILTTIYSLPVPANTAANLQVQVIGAKSDYSAAVSGTINVGVVNDGGGAFVIDGSQNNIITTLGTTATATGSNVGDNIAILVRGVDTETWNWRVIVAQNVLNV